MAGMYAGYAEASSDNDSNNDKTDHNYNFFCGYVDTSSGNNSDNVEGFYAGNDESSESTTDECKDQSYMFHNDGDDADAFQEYLGENTYNSDDYDEDESSEHVDTTDEQPTEQKASIESFSQPTIPKYYAVAKGRTPGIYENWGICNEQVYRYSRAVFKRFNTRTAAEEFINNYNLHMSNKQAAETTTTTTTTEELLADSTLYSNYDNSEEYDLELERQALYDM